jgi:hypothetical protein
MIWASAGAKSRAVLDQFAIAPYSLNYDRCPWLIKSAVA